MPNLVSFEECCGCSACASKCPKNAISMIPDKGGFLHPNVNSQLCVECGACERACPGLDPVTNKSTDLKTFIVQHRDSVIRYQSTSGGAFTAIASYVINHGGVVFGATMNSQFEVFHDFVRTIEDLQKFRNSKYVQSDIRNSYKAAKQFLKDGIDVCFSGTPCQINGLYKYLGKDYDNLITVDVVCKSVPSPYIFKKYIDFKKGSEGHLSDIVFRDKKRGFLYCTMAHYDTNANRMIGKSIYRRGSESDEWLRLFLSGKISRESCFSCHYQTKNRMSDFTLGDIWNTGIKNFDDNKGTTLLHAWTPKAINILNELTSVLKVQQYPCNNDRAIERKHILKNYSNRHQLFADAVEMKPESFFRKYAPYNLKVRIKNYGRCFLWRLSIQSFVRNIKHSIIHRK